MLASRFIGEKLESLLILSFLAESVKNKNLSMLFLANLAP